MEFDHCGCVRVKAHHSKLHKGLVKTNKVKLFIEEKDFTLTLKALGVAPSPPP